MHENQLQHNQIKLQATRVFGQQVAISMILILLTLLGSLHIQYSYSRVSQSHKRRKNGAPFVISPCAPILMLLGRGKVTVVAAARSETATASPELKVLLTSGVPWPPMLSMSIAVGTRLSIRSSASSALRRRGVDVVMRVVPVHSKG